MTSPNASEAVIRRGPAAQMTANTAPKQPTIKIDGEQVEHQRRSSAARILASSAGAPRRALVPYSGLSPSVSRRTTRTTPRGATGRSRSDRRSASSVSSSALSTTARRLSGLAAIPGCPASRTAPRSDFARQRALPSRRQLGDPTPDGGVRCRRRAAALESHRSAAARSRARRRNANLEGRRVACSRRDVVDRHADNGTTARVKPRSEFAARGLKESQDRQTSAGSTNRYPAPGSVSR